MILPDLLLPHVRSKPDAPAVVSGDATVTFRQLYHRSRRLAWALCQHTEHGDRVAVLSRNIPGYVDAYYAAPLAGLGLVHLNPRLHLDELAALCARSRPEVLMIDPGLEALGQRLAERSPRTRVLELSTQTGQPTDLYATSAEPWPPSETPRRAAAGDLAWLLFTSGTTGTPKGAVLSHQNLLTNIFAEAIEWRLHEDDVFLLPFPMCHVAGYTVPLYHMRGCPVVLLESFEPARLLQQVEQHAVTSMSIAPTMIAMLLEDPAIERYDLRSLRWIIYGASSMSLPLLQRAMDRFGGVFAQGFGSTELAGTVLFMDQDVHRRGLDHPELLLAAGRPKVLAEFRLVDDEMRDVARGEVGEIVVRGPQVFREYWEDEAATAAAFVDGWFLTGDLARQDDEGLVYVVDRKKDVIISGGANVYPREVEDVLHGHPDVAAAAVFGADDPVWGEIVAAAVVAREGADVSAAELTAWCQAHIASYKKPSRILFVPSLPKNASGKVLKRELRQLLADDCEVPEP